MHSVRYSRRANADLEDITDYTARTWGAEQAKTYIRAIRTKIQEIAKGDVVAQRLDGINGRMFKARVNRHLIIYEETAEVVSILRILHESMDIPRHISLEN